MPVIRWMPHTKGEEGMQKHIILILKLFPLCLLAACATLYPVETAYKDALRAESSEDLEAAASHYQKALVEASKSKDTRWYIDRALFPDYRKQWGLQRIPVTTNMMHDDLKRVSAAQKAIKAKAEKAIKAEKDEVEKKVMLEAFNSIIANYKNEDCLHSASQGRDYIAKYRNIEGSRWQEIENLINQEGAMRVAFRRISTLDKYTDDVPILSEGIDYINRYRSMECSRWAEIEKLVNEARVISKEKEKGIMQSAYQSISELDKKEDYEFIISKGREYIDKYRNVEDSDWQKIEKLVIEAETEKEKDIMRSVYQSIMVLNKNASSAESVGKVY